MLTNVVMSLQKSVKSGAALPGKNCNFIAISHYCGIQVGGYNLSEYECLLLGF